MTLRRSDFLVELGTEELPPTALRDLELAFAAGIRAGLDKAGVAHGEIISFATPRRLAVRVSRLASHQPDQHIKRRGPPTSAAFDGSGRPTRAATAFAESCGASVASLQSLEEGKGSFLFYVGTKPGAEVTALLPQIVQSSLDALPIPRRMRWGSGTAEFVRPVHWLIMLYGRQIVPARLLDTEAGNTTQGHRFHAPRPMRITSPASYESALSKRGFVLPGFESRRGLIRARVLEVAASLGGRPLMDPELLDEVTALVEWPVPLAGRFEERFLQLPREVLISTLQDHQRYFAVEDEHGHLLPSFITVSNIESRDPSKVREGNERVVRPRLADAAFFWDQDRKQTLASRRQGLDAMTFQVKLGSLGDKVRRIRALAGEIASAGIGRRGDAERAAELCKCDLLTAMVGEFPELQGIMGTYYAFADGEPAEVAVAIREHYLPRGAGDELPETHGGLVVALADKLDTLAGIFEIGEKPSGAKDPFGLRRAAIGVLRILIERQLDLDLRKLLATALANVRADVERIRTARAEAAAATRSVSATSGPQAPAIQPARPAQPPQSQAAKVSAEDAVYDFIMERLRTYYLERAAIPSNAPATASPTASPTAPPTPAAPSAVAPASAAAGSAAPATTTSNTAFTTEMFDAVLATRPVSPLDFDARLKALRAFLDLPEATSLAAANKRISNILRKAGELASRQADRRVLQDEAEIRLFEAMHALKDQVASSVRQKEYANALGRLAQLRPPVDDFFEKVMVMDENVELRNNRLALLAELHGLFIGIADLSRLPG